MKKLFITLLILAYTLTASTTAFAAVPQTVIDTGLQYLKSQQKDDGHIDGFSGVTDWAAMAFASEDIDLTTVKTASGKSLMEYLQVSLPTPSSSSIEWSRRILTVTAANQNPYDLAGTNLVNGLKTHYNNNQIGNTTAVNDDAFGLIALLASKESTTSAIITDTVLFVLSKQHTDGGFSYSTDTTIDSDIDDTAAAIMALLLAKKQGVATPGLQTAIDNAKEYILSHQNSDGGFAYDPNPQTSWDTSSNVATTSWVLMALSSLGISTEESFTKAENYLLTSQQADGSFPYQPIFPPGDTFDTSYAVFALNESFWPLRIFSGPPPSTTQDTTPTPTPTATPTPSPTPTNSPTPTPIVIGDTVSNSNPTPTPTPTKTSASNNQTVNRRALQQALPKQDSLTLGEAKKEVLGRKTDVGVSGEQKRSIPVSSKLFFGFGMLFLSLSVQSTVKRYKRVN